LSELRAAFAFLAFWAFFLVSLNKLPKRAREREENIKECLLPEVKFINNIKKIDGTYNLLSIETIL